MEFAREPGRGKQPSWVPNSPDSSLVLQPLFVIVISLMQEQTVVMWQGHRDGKNLMQQVAIF